MSLTGNGAGTPHCCFNILTKHCWSTLQKCIFSVIFIYIFRASFRTHFTNILYHRPAFGCAKVRIVHPCYLLKKAAFFIHTC